MASFNKKGNVTTQVFIESTVIPAQAGIQIVNPIAVKGSQPYQLDSRLRGNDEWARVLSSYKAI